VRVVSESATTPRTRMSADARREQLVEIAFGAFAVKGFHGASTEPIARDAGISHAYLFRVFPTKKSLFIACGMRAGQRILAAFRDAAAAHARGEVAEEDGVLGAMGDAYRDLLTDREILMMQMQIWVASASDPDIRTMARAQYLDIVREIQRLSGADPQTVHDFMAQGMLLSVAASLSLSELSDAEPLIAVLLPHVVDEAS
jgi:AcrR family transcriptional regulator